MLRRYEDRGHRFLAGWVPRLVCAVPRSCSLSNLAVFCFVFLFQSQSQFYRAQLLLPLGKFNITDECRREAPVCPTVRMSTPPPQGSAPMSTAGVWATHPHRGHQVSRATIPRTPSRGERGREKQLQSQVSSSGSGYEWPLPLLSLAVERVAQSSNSAH